MNFNIGNFGVPTTSATPFSFGNSLASAGRCGGRPRGGRRAPESKNAGRSAAGLAAGEVRAPGPEPQPWRPASPVLEDAGWGSAPRDGVPVNFPSWNRTYLPGGAGSERAVLSRSRFPNCWGLFPNRSPAVRPLLWDSWTPAVTSFHVSCICHWNFICLSVCFPRETSLIRTAAPVRLLRCATAGVRVLQSPRRWGSLPVRYPRVERAPSFHGTF